MAWLEGRLGGGFDYVLFMFYWFLDAEFGFWMRFGAIGISLGVCFAWPFLLKKWDLGLAAGEKIDAAGKILGVVANRLLNFCQLDRLWGLVHIDTLNLGIFINIECGWGDLYWLRSYIIR